MRYVLSFALAAAVCACDKAGEPSAPKGGGAPGETAGPDGRVPPAPDAAGKATAGKRAQGVDPDSGESVPDDPMGVVVKKLANGFTVMVSENHESPRAECWITTRAGSAKDPADATGLAHYLEHMNFKGTSKLGTLDWEKEKVHLDKITQLYDELF